MKLTKFRRSLQKRIYTFLLAVIISTPTFAEPAQSPLELQSITAEPNVMLLIDDSGSMGGRISRTNPAQRLATVKTAVNNLIDNNDGIRFCAASFGSEQGAVMNSNSICRDSDAPGHKNTLKTFVNNLTPGGWTPLSEALYDVNRYFRAKDEHFGNFNGASYPDPIEYPCQTSSVILLTDGAPTHDWDSNLNIGDDPIATDGTPSLPNWDGVADGSNQTVDDVALFGQSVDMKTGVHGGVNFDNNDFDTQYMKTHVIAFTLNIPILVQTASNGGGIYATTSSSAGLEAALQNALNNSVVHGTGDGASSSSVTLAGGSDFFITSYDTDTWKGDLLKFALQEAPDGTLAATANLQWSASENIPLHNNRKLFTSQNSNTAIDFTTASLTPPNSPADKRFTLEQKARLLNTTVPSSSDYRYVRFIADTPAGDRNFMAVAEFGLKDTNNNTISISSSQLSSKNPTNRPLGDAIDGNNNTFWRTQGNRTNNLPHELRVDLLSDTDLGEMIYTPRQNNIRGRFTDYRVLALSEDNGTYTSMADAINNTDDSDWTLLAQGVFATDTATKTVSFTTAPPNPQGFTIEQLIEYTRGDISLAHFDIDNNTPNKVFRFREAPNGHAPIADIVHSTPTYIKNDEFNYPDNDYVVYKNHTDQTSRTGIVYVGSNDGIVHAFNEQSGVELFGFIPDTLLGKLKDFSQPNYTENGNHRFLADGPSTGIDAKINSGADWATIYTSSFGAGGKGMFVLNVTDPNALPNDLLMWEINDRTPIDPNSNSPLYTDMGYVLSKPKIGRVRDSNGDDKWVLITGNGVDSTDGKAYIYVINLDDGSLFQDPIEIDGVVGKNGVTSVVATDLDNNSYIDRIYATTLEGEIWRLDYYDHPGQGSNTTLGNVGEFGFVLSNGGQNQPLFTTPVDDNGTPSDLTDDIYEQPITAEVTITFGPLERKGVLVSVGTGKFYAETDLYSQLVQSFYTVHDNSTLGNFSSTPNTSFIPIVRGDLVEQTLSADPTDSTGRIVSTNPVNYASTDKGWYADLPDTGERIVTKAFVFFNRIAFTTQVVNAVNQCGLTKSSWQIQLDRTTGKGPNNREFFGGRGTANVGIVTDFSTQSPVFIQDTKGNITYPKLDRDGNVDTSPNTAFEYFRSSQRQLQ